jgi:hypothetical protein
METEKIFYEKLNCILKGENVLSILMIGAGVKIENEYLDTLRDIDLFVITDEDYEFEREVIRIEGVSFDISYMSLKSFEKAIDDEIPFLINSLQSYKFVYNTNKNLIKLLEKIKHIYMRGPKKLEKDEIDYIRFKLYQDFEDILNRKKDVLSIKFLMNNLYYNALTSYYKLHGYWIPKDKKILKSIQKFDYIIYNLCIEFIKEEEVNEKLKILNEIIDYVLKPYGGVIKVWKRNRFLLI